MTLKKLVFLGVLGLADCTPGREPHSVAASSYYNRHPTWSRSFWGDVMVDGPADDVITTMRGRRLGINEERNQYSSRPNQHECVCVCVWCVCASEWVKISE